MTTLSNNDYFWDWWAAQDARGRYFSGGWKYQRERWHLLALHSPEFLAALSREVWLELSVELGPVEVSIQSAWVDQTPQASAMYRSKSREHKVKCELGDLIVITEIEFDGESARPEDRRAVLVQAKVTSEVGKLDKASSGSSSYKERNLLELCSSTISLNTGTGTSKHIGDFSLGCSSTSPGLKRYAKYLTIPARRTSSSHAPYQAMWPHSRDVQDGSSKSWALEISNMLLPQTPVAMGAPLAGVGSREGWRKLVQSVTKLYALEKVGRFPKATGGGFPRVNRVSVSYEGATATSPGPAIGLGFISDFGLSLTSTGNGMPPPSKRQMEFEDESTPAIPYLFVQARVSQPRETALNDNYLGRRLQAR